MDLIEELIEECIYEQLQECKMEYRITALRSVVVDLESIFLEIAKKKCQQQEINKKVLKEKEK